MKEKHLLTLLSIEAAACVLFCILQRSVSGFFSTIVAFLEVPEMQQPFFCTSCLV